MKPQKLTPGELEQIAALGDPQLTILSEWANKHFQCSHCGKCTRRCEVLAGPGLDIGAVEAAYDAIVALPPDEQPAAVVALVQEDYALYNALRQCCFCGFCTAACGHHILAADRMRDWRQLFMRAGLMPPDDSKLVMVDNEWHIFSAYRAIYGIGYADYLSLAQAAEAGPGAADTLFFPGCSLVSYAPEVVRAVADWLAASGARLALSDGCCGSPLMSAGMFDRAAALRHGFIEQMQAAGITRMVTICPGCGEEFADDMPEGIEIVPLPELLRECAAKCRAAGMESGFAPLRRESLTFFDSCHDRFDSAHAQSIRALMRTYLPEAKQCEIEHRKQGTLCCGAGGAVASYDADITDRRVWRVIDEAKATGAATLVTMCPTCTYTIAQACLAAPDQGIDNKHYLELLFGVEIDWARVFQQLGDMWTGEYGPWLNQTFF